MATAADATGKALVIISSTVSAGTVGTKFRDVAVPVITWETALYAPMNMTDGSLSSTTGPDRQRPRVWLSPTPAIRLRRA